MTVDVGGGGIKGRVDDQGDDGKDEEEMEGGIEEVEEEVGTDIPAGASIIFKVLDGRT